MSTSTMSLQSADLLPMTDLSTAKIDDDLRDSLLRRITPLPRRRPWSPRVAIPIAAVAVAAMVVTAFVVTSMLEPGAPPPAPVAAAAAAQPAAPVEPATARRLDCASASCRAFAKGKEYFARMWWADGVKHLQIAIDADPELRTNPELVELAVRGFITTPTTNGVLAKFLREDIGAAAVPRLEQVARDHPNPKIRARAKAQLRRMVAH